MPYQEAAHSEDSHQRSTKVKVVKQKKRSIDDSISSIGRRRDQDDEDGSPPSSWNTSSRGFWENLDNQKKFFGWAANRLGIDHDLDGWYAITRADLARIGGRSLFNHYESLYAALAALYPDHEWLPWRFAGGVPREFWADPANHRRFFDWAARQLNVVHYEDWYRVKREAICELGGSGMLTAFYNGSLIKALERVYPEFEWLPWRFHGLTPQGFWRDAANQRKFFDWVAEQLGIQHGSPEGWYQVRARDIERLGGSGLIYNYFNNSLVAALAQVYPEIQWVPWRFACGVPTGFWSDPANQRWFFDYVAAQLGINKNKPEDWFEVKPADIQRCGGMSFLRTHYEGSLAKALTAVYPELGGQQRLPVWRFRHFPLTAATFEQASGKEQDNGENQQLPLLRQYVDYLAEQLQLAHFDEWYRVSHQQLRRTGSYNVIVNHYGGLYSVLKRVYPWHDWKEDEFINRVSSRRRGPRRRSAAQRWLRVAVERLFPGKEIIEEYCHPGIRFSSNSSNTDNAHEHHDGMGEMVTLDLWVPSLSLAFEYQGEQHYHQIYAFGDDLLRQQKRDDDKVAACSHAGVTLVVVPYWWDGRVESLAATIQSIRPDLASASSTTSSSVAAASDMNATTLSSFASLAAAGSVIPNTPAPMRMPHRRRPQPQ